MAINFTNNPNVNDTVIANGLSWKWDGTVWQATNATVGYSGSVGSGYTGSASTIAGPTGYTGSKGDIGYGGSAGYTGSASTIVGYTGSKGDIGYVGSASTIIGYTSSAGGQIYVYMYYNTVTGSLDTVFA